MKASVSTDRVIYPDVSHELSDLVAQQPAPAQAPGVKVKRLGVDEYRALQSAGLTQMDRLTRRDLAPFASFGYVPRPREWSGGASALHDPASREMLRSTALALRLNVKLDELFGKVPGQIENLPEASRDVRSFLPQDFPGLVFQPETAAKEEEAGGAGARQFIQERSLTVVDELRRRLHQGSIKKGSLVEDSMEKASTLLQLRLKLQQLDRLGNFIERCFSQIDAVDLGKLKNPQLC